jgi:hypothetical protein
MNPYDARQTFLDCLEAYIAGIETDERLTRMCDLVSGYHDALTSDAADLVKAVLELPGLFHGTYAEAADAVRERLGRGTSSREAA